MFSRHVASLMMRSNRSSASPRVICCPSLRSAHSSSGSSLQSISPDIQDLAAKIESARSQNHQIPPLTSSTPGLSQDTSYQISSAIRALRSERNSDVVIGRKIGFTNKSIWPEYNVDRSNWSYMYRSSVVDFHQRSLDGSRPFVCDLSEYSKLEPKIEPEIVLGLKAMPSSRMGDEQILECIDWIAHGFEVVVSIYPGWKFTAVDTTAAFALHGRLLLGKRAELPLRSVGPAELLRRLQEFKIKLYRNGSLEDEGVGSNALGSPIKALRHLAELLEKDEVNVPLGQGEMVTTGTLTRALSISDGDRWHTEIDGLDVSPMDVKFKVK